MVVSPSTYSVWAPRAETVELVVHDPASAAPPPASGTHSTSGAGHQARGSARKTDEAHPHEPVSVRESSQPPSGDRAGQPPSGRTQPMRRQPDGWFICDTPMLHGARYGFLVDGEGPFPDPRSRRQPDGIHGLSEVWDPTQAQLHSPPHTSASIPVPGCTVGTPGGPGSGGCHLSSPLGRPLAGEVLYELHVGTFTPGGTFDAAIERLGYLRELGITAVELMPVQPFGGTRNWGYDGVCWHAVHEGYGGPDGLARFIRAAHGHGLGVILDVVYNHFGPDGNYTGIFGPYTSAGSTGWGDTVNLQGAGSDEVRSYILDAVTYWTSTFGVDGLRLDAVHAYDDTGAVSIMEQIRDAAQPSYVIAESDQNDPRLTETYRIAQWDDDVHHAIHAAVSGETHGYYGDFRPLQVLATTLRRVFWHDGRYSTFRGRTHGRPVSHPERWRFVVYTTTHDQTGNRAAGDRPSMSLHPQQQLAKAALVLLGPYTPMLFMGEEWGASTPFAFFVDHESAELNEAVRQGRTQEFARAGWDAEAVLDPAAESTFTASTLNWAEQAEPDHAQVLAGYRELLRLRRALRLHQRQLRDVRWASPDPADVVSPAAAGPNPVLPPSEASGRWVELEYGDVVDTAAEPGAMGPGPGLRTHKEGDTAPAVTVRVNLGPEDWSFQVSPSRSA